VFSPLSLSDHLASKSDYLIISDRITISAF
jgi:hypothetical protein